LSGASEASKADREYRILSRYAGLLSRALLFLSGFLISTGLMVGDELLTLAAYCGPDCRYKIPFLGDWQIYDAYGFAWALILSGVGLLLVEALKFFRASS